METLKNLTPGAKTLLFAAAALAVATLPAHAQGATSTDATITPVTTAMTAPDAAPGEAPWQFGVSVPLWLVGINGNTTVRGTQRDFNRSFSELKDHLDTALSLALDVRKGKLGFYGGFGYMKFSNNGQIALSAVTQGTWSGDLKFVIVDAGVAYNLIKTEGEHPFILDGTLGLRYWYADANLKIKTRGGTLISDKSDTRNLEDPMIGLRGSQYLTSKLHLDFAGDIGGFGISDNQAELDWSATGMATYDFVKWFSLSAGYKAVGLDASQGSGAGKNGLNVIFSGALIAAKFKF